MAYSWKDGLPSGSAALENTNDPLATLTAVDGMVAAFSYSLSGTDRGLFEIDEHGVLSLKNALDYEALGSRSNRQFSVAVRAHSEDGARQEERTFVLTLQNANDVDIDWRDGGMHNLDGRALSENNSEGVRIASFRATDGDSDATVNYSLSGSDAAYFSLDEYRGVGRLYLTSSLDYEDANHVGNLYSVAVVVDSTDGSPAISQLYVLTVNNVNEANLDDTAAYWQTRSSGASRYENEAGGGLANFVARDADGGAISYWLSGSDAELFSLSSSNRLYVKESLDHESTDGIAKNNRYSVVVNALGLDGGTTIGDGANAVTQTFVLTISNVNEFESNWEAGGNHTGANISEGNGVGLSLADFGAVDGDGITVTYGLRGGHLQDSHFQIDKDTGVLSARQEFNFESRSHYSVVVQARSEYSNDGSARLEQTFIVTVGNVNENESTKWDKNRPTSRTIYENNEAGLSLADFGATDGDRTAVTYSLSGDDATYFSVNSESGVLSLRSGLDYEDANHTAEYYSVVVNADSVDGSNGISSLYVLRVRDAVVEINWVADGNPSAATVSEGDAIKGLTLADFNIVSGGHIEIGDESIRAFDGDDGNVSYWLSGSDRLSFAIDSKSGVLSLSRDRNYESDRSSHQYSVVVNVGQSNVDGSISELFILSVGNENEFTTEWSGGGIYNRDGRTINENNNEGYKVAEFRATDGDKVDIDYSLTGADAGLFSIEDRSGGVGRLYLKSSLNYEDKALYSVVVVADSVDGSAAISQLYVLTISNVNEFESNWEAGGNHTGANISEGNGVGLSLADFGATDGDGITVTYGLRGGHRDDSYFQIDKDTGVLSAGQEFNFEVREHYSVVVRARSIDGSARLEQEFILTIGNVNDKTTGWESGRPTSRSILENNEVGLSLADFGATDGDRTAVTYSLSGDDATYFSVNSESGVLSLMSGLDYEGGHAEYYSVVVNANSVDGSNGISGLYVLRVRDAVVEINWGTNGNPSAATVSEGDAIKGLSVADFNIVSGGHIEIGDESIRAFDGDDGNVSYWLSGSDRLSFAIDSKSGVLSLSRDRNYESDRSSHQYSVVVNVGQSNVDGSISELFILSVGNENEFTTEWRDGGIYNRDGRTINENNNEGYKVAEFRATDGDKVDIDYSLTGADAGLFSIEDRSGGVGRLYLKSSLNYEDKALYSVVVVANSADDSVAISQLYVLTISNVNESDINDTTATWSRQSRGRSRDENEDPRELTQFEARDADGPGISYWLSGDNVSMFSIDTVGKLYTTQTFDYESTDGIAKNNRYSVVVNALGTAGDNVAQVGDGLLALTQTYILTIRNGNDPTTWETGGNPSGGNISENGGIGVSLADFGAIDGDGATVTYGLRGNYRQDDYFNIDKDTGVLTSAKEFNFEGREHYTVVVRARSIDGSDRLEQEFILTLQSTIENTNDLDWASTGNPDGATINENNGVGISLGDFNNSNIPAGESVTYGLAGEDADYFDIDAGGNLGQPGYGWLTVKSTFDYESQDAVDHNYRYSVVVVAGTTDDTATISRLFVLTIDNVNDVGVDWERSGRPTSRTILENNNIGASIADFGATDGDGASVTYSLSGDDATYFSINSESGVLSLKSSFNYESEHSEYYSVVVNANSVDGSEAISSNYVLRVRDAVVDINWAAVGNPSTVTISETNAVAGLSVADFNIVSGGHIQIGDESIRAFDGDGGNVSYWLSSGKDSSEFMIDRETGVLSLRQGRNYETDRDSHEYTVVVNVGQNSGDHLSQLFILSVADVNEKTTWVAQQQPLGGRNYLPDGTTVETIELGEGIAGSDSDGAAAGQQVGKFKAVDEDVGIYITYGLSGTDETYFSIDSNGRLYLASQLDFENTDHGVIYSVVIHASSTADGDTNGISTLFVISLTDRNDPTIWETGGNPTGNVILQDNTIGTSLADFNATNDDGISVSYSLSGSDADYFNIDSTTGVLTTKSIFDFEDSDQGGFYTVVVEATSTDGNSAINQIFILTLQSAIENTNDLDWASTGNPDGATINENNSVGISLGDFNNSNIPAGESVTYGLAGEDADYFDIGFNTGWFSAVSSFDYESQDAADRDYRYSVVVVAGTADDTTAISRLFVLTIGDVNNNTNDWASDTTTGKTLNENRKASIAVAHFDSNGPLPDGVSMTYAITGGDRDYFDISPRDGGRWRLSATSSFDYESDYGQSIDNRYSVIITANATEDGTAISRTYILTIGDVSNTPDWASNIDTGITRNENTADTTLWDFRNDSPLPAGVSITYGLSGDHAGDFTISPRDGGDFWRFRGGGGYDYESEDGQSINNRYSVIITANATEDGTAISRTYILTIGDVGQTADWNYDYDNNPAGNAIDENSTSNYYMGTFQVNSSEDVTYHLDGDNKGYFSLATHHSDSSIVHLRTTSVFDYESEHGQSIDNRYSVVVVANTANTTEEGKAISRTFILTINDFDNTGGWNYDYDNNPTRKFIDENSSSNYYMGAFQINSSEDVTYSLEGDNKGYFSLATHHSDSSIVHLRTTSVFDYESDYGQSIDNRYSVVIHANATTEGTEKSRLFVLHINDDTSNNTTDWTAGDDGKTIAENNSVGFNPGDRITDFGNSQPAGINITYGLSGEDANYFNIHNRHGWLFVASTFDYESDYGQSIDNRYSVVVHANATDGESTEISRLFILTIDDINNTGGWNYDYDNNPAGNAIDENSSSNHYMGTFQVNSSQDVDITYGLSGDNKGYFSLATHHSDSSIVHLRTTSVFDYESEHGQSIDNRYSVLITANATDDESTEISRLFILTIDNVNNTGGWNYDYDNNPAGNAIDENSSSNYYMGAFQINSSEDVTYGLSGDNANYFKINVHHSDSSIVHLRTTSVFDYESEHGQSIDNRYSVVVHANATDEGTAISRTFILTINDIDNKNDWNSNTSTGKAIDENRGAGLNLWHFRNDGDLPAGVDITYGLSGDAADYFTITDDVNAFGNFGRLRGKNNFDYESEYGQSNDNRYSVVVTANATREGTAISRVYILTINDVNNTNNWASNTSNGKAINENASVKDRLWDFRQVGPLSEGHITYGLSGDNTSHFRIDNMIDSNGNGFGRLFAIGRKGNYYVLQNGFDYESEYGQSINNRYSIIVTANGTEEGTEISRTYILTINDVTFTHVSATTKSAPDQPAGLNGKILFDGDADNIGGVSDGIGNEGLIIIGDDLVATQYSDGAETNLVINNVENFEQSFVGYTDADGNTQNHWFFVRDDAGDNTGHIVFDADGLDVNLESLANGGATTTPDQINLLAGLNFGSDGDFNKPDDLTLDLNGNNAASLTHDQFLALIGGSNNIDFI